MEATLINLTSYLKLGKPVSNEHYNVSIFNNNADIIDQNYKRIIDLCNTLTTDVEFQAHSGNLNNPHRVTKEQLGLSNVVNKKQMYGILENVTQNGVPVFNGNGCTLKDSGYTIEKSVPPDAKFTDTIYNHPQNNFSGEFSRVEVDMYGHVVAGTNPTTLAEYGITDAANKSHLHTAEEIGADPVGSAADALKQSKEYSDNTYTQATGYTDTQIAQLVNADKTTLSTINEIQKAMSENEDVVTSLSNAIGNKASDVEFQAHSGNNNIHVTVSKTEKWDGYESRLPSTATPQKAGIIKPDIVTTNTLSDGTLSAKLKGCIVGQSGSTATNPYYKFASCRITYGEDYYISFKVSTGFVATQDQNGILTACIRGDKENLNNMSTFGWEYAGKAIDPSCFYLIYKKNETYFDVELWVKIQKSFVFYHFDVIQEETRSTKSNNIWKLYSTSSAGSESALPEGYTILSSTLFDIKNKSGPAPVTNLLATEPGTALDATMGKVLDEKVSAISSNLSKTELVQKTPAFSGYTKGTVYYKIVSGICYWSMYDFRLSKTLTEDTIAVQGLPIPEVAAFTISNISAFANAAANPLFAQISSAGNLCLQGGAANTRYYSSGCYPTPTVKM